MSVNSLLGLLFCRLSPLRALLLAIGLTLTGCSSAQPIDSAGHAIQPTDAAQPNRESTVRSFPKGLVPGDLNHLSAGQSHGVYPGVGDPDPSCCWLGPSATVMVSREGDQKNVTAVVYVPDVSLFKAHPENVKFRVGASVHVFTRLGPGVHDLSFELDSATKPGPFVLGISGDAWSPSKSKINSDSRTLSVILSEVRVK